MTDPLNRGTTPARARDASQRPGTFRKGHRKFGGRKKGTPNVVTKDLKVAIVEAAHRLGSDGKGKDGLVGYLMALAVEDTRTFGALLRAMLPLQIAPEKSHLDIIYRSVDEILEELDLDDDAEEVQAESREATQQPKQE